MCLSQSSGSTNLNRGLFEGSIVVLTFWDIDRVIAVEGEVIEHGTLGAPTDGGVSTLLADIEETAVIGLHVSGMVKSLTIGVDLGGVGATETVGKNLNTSTAACPETLELPLAGAGEFVEDKAGWTASLHGYPSCALIVLVAH